jgi:hypothetical protein
MYAQNSSLFLLNPATFQYRTFTPPLPFVSSFLCSPLYFFSVFRFLCPYTFIFVLYPFLLSPFPPSHLPPSSRPVALLSFPFIFFVSFSSPLSFFISFLFSYSVSFLLLLILLPFLSIFRRSFGYCSFILFFASSLPYFKVDCPVDFTLYNKQWRLVTR